MFPHYGETPHVMFLFYAFILHCSLVGAQDSKFVTNPNWQTSDITVTSEERIEIAKAAIEKTLSIFVVNGQTQIDNTTHDGNYGPAGRLYSQMADFDAATKQTLYKDRLLEYFAQAEALHPSFLHGKAHGIAATHAYKVYSDSVFLTYAENAWKSGTDFTLNEENLQSGTIPFKNVTIKPTCGALSMAGGTFWITDPNDAYVNTLATASYLLVSALLAESTKDDKYRDAAMKTESFYFNLLRNARGDLLDGVHGDLCSNSDASHPSNEGLMMEGLAVLASVTQNETIAEHFFDVLERTILNSNWHSANGIINADTAQASAEHVGQYIVRGLTAFYNRNTTPSELRTYIRGYLGVQYNAVLDNAREPGDDVYGASWIGPPFSTFALDNQTNALTALVAAIPLHNETVDPTPTGTNKTTSPNSPNDDSQKSLNLGAIVGGVVGGLAFLALLITLVLCLLRRRQRKPLSNLDASADVTETSPTQTSGTLPRINHEKKVRPDHPRTPSQHLESPSISVAQESAPSDRSSTQVSSTQGTGTTRFGSVPTELLVRLLNDRLQPARWREDEEPPEYASAHNFV
ncbi:hypothetical protein VNI00_013916 [Paramarasmius palmivorus]|uniref:Glycoside hydrolase family 76 protein n=1 Tax=Paramarasmius palmivorus TaxID=297713 RepID=A0AAW0BW92_9AGAR